MEYRNLGNSELNVSILSLGCLNFGLFCDQETTTEIINTAIDLGVNCIDTAALYGGPKGHCETLVGKAIEGQRDKVILATKFGADSNARGSGLKGGGKRDYIVRSVEESLTRLNIDYIDLYQLHWPERKTNFFGRLGYEHKDDSNGLNDFEKILITLEKFIKQGKIRYIGLSNETSWGLSKFLEVSKLKSLPKMMSVQNAYNLLCRTYEIGIAEISIREESGLLAYSPLAGGFLTGKYQNNNLPENSRQKLFGDYYTRYNKPHASLVIEKYFNIAKKFGLDFAQMSIKFCEIQPFMTSVIIGATTMEQLKINIESVNVNLSVENITEINKIQKLYPNPCP